MCSVLCALMRKKEREVVCNLQLSKKHKRCEEIGEVRKKRQTHTHMTHQGQGR